nr:alkaline phosphatase family protein [Mycobacterium stomatepiae]
MLAHRRVDRHSATVLTNLAHRLYPTPGLRLSALRPQAPQSISAARDVDHALGPLLDAAAQDGVTVIAVSEYGIAGAHRPVNINRELRRQGYLSVYTQQGREYLDPGQSRAFAVADHQVAHIYVRDDADLSRVASLVNDLDGVDQVLDRTQQQRLAIDHPRSGELVSIAEPGGLVHLLLLAR